MKKILAVLLVLALVLMSAGTLAEGEASAWTCPACGQEGNTGNFCPNCAEPRPAEEPAEEPEGEAEPTEAPAAPERETVFFGHYPQQGEADPIEWIVLEEQDGKAMLISKYLLDMKIYHPYGNRVTWENSELRAWLNEDFLGAAFSEEEQAAIALTDVDNSAAQGNMDWYDKDGNDTQDKVYLLSYQEANRYFPREEDRICAVTDHALFHYAYSGDGDAGWWWLRSPGRWSFDTGVAGHEGGFFSVDSDRVAGCIRPVIRVDTESDVFRAEQNAPAETAEAPAITDEDLAGVWFGFEMDYENMSGPNSDFRFLRFDPETRHVEILYCRGYDTPDPDGGNYRVNGDILEVIEAGGYKEEYPFKMRDGKLMIDRWGKAVLTRIDEAEYPADPEANPYMGNAKYCFIASREDGSITFCVNFEGQEVTSFEVPGEVFGRTVTAIDQSCFEYEDNLEQIILPDSIEVIGNQAFYGDSIETIRLPAGLKIIRPYAFSYCRDLKGIVIPEGTEHIGGEAFAYCDAMSVVVLPASVTCIEDDAFFGEYIETAEFIVPKGSYADDWCWEHGLKVRALEGEAYAQAVAETESRLASGEESSGTGAETGGYTTGLEGKWELVEVRNDPLADTLAQVTALGGRITMTFTGTTVILALELNGQVQTKETPYEYLDNTFYSEGAAMAVSWEENYLTLSEGDAAMILRWLGE